jgi:hypothetical protein
MVVYGFVFNGELVNEKSSAVSLFESEAKARKAQETSKKKEVKEAAIVPFRLTKTVVVG